MGAGRLSVSTSLALIAACGHARSSGTTAADRILVEHAKSFTSKTVAAPASLEPPPWKVGQWVAYLIRRPHAGGEQRSFQRVRVIAEDSCGIWIEHYEVDDVHQVTATMCFRASPTRSAKASEVLDRLKVAIVEWDDRPPVVTEFGEGQDAAARLEYEWLAWSLVAPSFDAGELLRENVDVPAGRFVGAIRRSGTEGLTLERWSHPEVPLSSTVKASYSDGTERVLVDFGHTTPSTVRRAVIAQSRFNQPAGRSRLSLEFAVGYDRFTETANQVATTATSIAWTSGYRVMPAITAIARGSGVLGVENGPDEDHAQEAFRLLGGVRWSPFHERRILSRLTFEGAFGFGSLQQSSIDDATAYGIAAEVAVGFILDYGRDWDLGLAVSDDIVLYNADEGLRHSVALSAFIRLYLPSRRRL